MSKLDQVNEILKELINKVTDIIGSAVVRTNGLIIASVLPEETNDRMLAAMVAALLGTSKRSAETLFQEGQFKSLSLEIDKDNMVLMSAGKVILITITKKEPNIGLVTLEIEHTCKKIIELFQFEV